jgi:serralysin
MSTTDEPQHNGNAETTATLTPTGDQRIDGLLSGVKWASEFITYSDTDAAGDYRPGYNSDADGDGLSAQHEGFSQLSNEQRIAVHFALNDFPHTQPTGAAGFSVGGFTKLEIDYAGSGAASGAMRLANTSDADTAYAYFPSSAEIGGDVWIGTAGDNPIAGNHDWHAIIHELGHSLGLKHGHETDEFGPLPGHVDSLEFSVMTYRTFIGDDTSGFKHEIWGAPQTFMMLDIAALQTMYGADYTSNSGDTVYTWSPTGGETFVDGNLAIDPGSNRIFGTIWDGGGIDTYNLSSYAADLRIDLLPGASSTFDSRQLANLGGGPFSSFARGNIFNALLFGGNTASLIENATGGSGTDSISGNQIANALAGNQGDDTLIGGGGNDDLNGGSGNDTLYGDAVADFLAFAGGYATLPQSSTNNSFGTALDITNNFALVADADITGASSAPHTTVNAVGNGSAGYYKITLGASSELTVDIDHTTDGLDSYVRLMSSTGTVLTFNNDSAGDPGSTETFDSRFVYLVGSGTYFIVVGRYLAPDIVTAGSAYELNVSVNTPNFGIAGNDLFNGGPGNDSLTGGAGLDTALYSGAKSAYAVTKHGVTMTVSGPDGTDTLTGIERLRFADASSRLANPSIDFGSDGKSDLVLHNAATGSVQPVLMDGVNWTAAREYRWSGWEIVSAQGDFNGDGKSDLVIRKVATGSVQLVLMDAVNWIEAKEYAWSGWDVVSALADFNGDGKSDLVLHNAATGSVQPLLMDGVNSIAAREYGWSGWKVVSVQGDFNGDGKSDLVIHKAATGSVQPVLMDGVNWTTAKEYGWSGWEVVSAQGDFNGDGKSDLVIHNAATGLVQPLLMDGVNWIEAKVYAWSGWDVVSAQSDFNGDGKSDLVIHNAASGSLQLLLMNGVNWTEAKVYAWSGWKIVSAQDDFNGDGKSDLVIHNAASGLVQLLLMDGVNWTEAKVYAWSGWKVLNGTDGRSVSGLTLNGTAGNDTLTGTNDNDWFAGLGGSDTLTGGGGSDRFVYRSVNDGVDTIADFARGDGGDVLDVRDVLVTYGHGVSNPASFIQLNQSGGNTTVSVNADGIGSDFADLAMLSGVTGLLLNDLLAQGNLAVA